MRSTALIVTLSIVLISTVAMAEVPGLMNYQGTLTDPAGAALDTTVSMTFSIYADSIGGSQVWTETQLAVAVGSGIFNVLLGSVNSMSETVFSEPVRWLGVQVGGDPELVPRQRIAATGYAFRAAEADTADYARSGAGGGSDGDWTISGSDMYSAVSGNVGIGTAGPAAVLHVSSTADERLFRVDDDGAADGTPFVIAQDGNVGINFQSYSDPQTRLHIMGPAGWSGDHELLRLELAGTYGGTKFIQYADSTYDWGLKLEDINGVNRLTISHTTGNVGIGTASPAEFLDVAGTTQMTGFKMPTGATNGYVLTSDAAGVGNWQPAGVGSGWSLTGNAGTTPGTHFLGTSDDQALELKVNGVRALRLEPDPTSPNLIGGPDVNWATAGVVGGVIGGGGENGANHRITDTYGTIAGGVGNTAGDNSGTVSDKMYATVGGGVGNTASGQASTVPGGGWNTAQGDFSFAAGRRAKANHDGAFVWGDSTDADFGSTGENQFLIRASGGVGIGTVSPTQLLDVAGTTQVTGFKMPTGATNGYVLTSDAAGVGNWQPAGVGSGWSLTGNAGTTPGTHFLGTTDDQALELKVNGVRALRLEPDPTSPNLIGGTDVNWAAAGVVGGVIGGGGESGANHRITDTYGTIAGGVGNTAGDNAGTVADRMYATVGGGVGNTASGQASTVPGGGWNTAQGDFSFAAGLRAKANHPGAFVWGDSTDADVTSTASNQFVIRASGGVGTTEDQALDFMVNSERALRLEPDPTSPNLIGGPSVNWATAGVVGGTIGGGGESGANHRITDTYGTIAGGVGNTAGDNSGTVYDKMYATVGGGVGNTASGQASTVPGGGWNTAQGDFSFAAGLRAKANHPGAFVWGDSTDADFGSTGENQFLIRASGGVGIGTVSPTQLLDVAGTTQMTGFKMPTGATNSYVLTSDASGVGTWQEAVAGSDGDWTISGDDMYAGVAGRVGIGTTVPGRKLDVKGSVSGSDTTVGSYGILGDATFGVSGYCFAGNAVIGSSYNGDGVAGVSYNGAGVHGSSTTGNAGHFDGNVRMTGFEMPTGASAGHVLTSDGSGLGTWQALAAVSDGDWTISGDHMYSAVPGSVGIGTVTPAADLHIASQGNPELRLDNDDWKSTLSFYQSSYIRGYLMKDDDDGRLNLSANGSTDHMVILESSGNVGVGKIYPVSELDVNGDINADGVYKLDGTTVLSTEGNANVIVGKNAGKNNTGNWLTCVGDSAGFNNQTSFNVFVGQKSGFANTSGWGASFMGWRSGRSNTTGFSNTFIGASAGEYNTEGWNNTFVGWSAGQENATGKNNTCLGYNAGGNANLGNANTYLGWAAGYNSTGTSNIFIGFQAGQDDTSSNRLIIESSGSTSPLIWGDFANDRLVINGNESHNSNNRTFFSNGSAGGTTGWYNDSDAHLKKEIATIPDALRKVQQLRGVNFEWRDTDRHDPGRQMGFVAQEAVKVIPEVVTGEDGHYAMQYGPITALLVEAVKELRAENRELKKEIEAIKAEIR